MSLMFGVIMVKAAVADLWIRERNVHFSHEPSSLIRYAEAVNQLDFGRKPRDAKPHFLNAYFKTTASSNE